jgi:hypothetical protein
MGIKQNKTIYKWNEWKVAKFYEKTPIEGLNTRNYKTNEFMYKLHEPIVTKNMYEVGTKWIEWIHLQSS